MWFKRTKLKLGSLLKRNTLKCQYESNFLEPLLIALKYWSADGCQETMTNKSFRFTQSLNINPKIPAVISKRSNTDKNMAYWNRTLYLLKFIHSWRLTVANKHVFSLNAPTQPVNPITNVTVPKMRVLKTQKHNISSYLPIHINIKAGSKAIFAILDKLWKVSFSLQAHTPTVSIPNPRSFEQKNKREFLINVT